MKMSQQISPLPVRFLMIAGAVASVFLFALICWFGTFRDVILASVMGIPCVLLLLFFAFGGDIPLKLRQRGYHRLMLVGIIGWVSILTGIFIIHFFFAHG